MAGSIVQPTPLNVGNGITKYSIAWTSDASGNVNANNTFAIKHGPILYVKFVPTNGGVQPSTNYSVTLLDPDNVDLLMGKGASLSNTAASIAVPVVSALSPAFTEDNAAVALVISAAGNTTNGRVDLYVGP